MHSSIIETQSRIEAGLYAEQSFTLPYWLRALAPIVWLSACAIPFLPFAVGTSALDAVLFHVPGNQGNWWHFLAGFPFFLAFPALWLSLRSLRGTVAARAGLGILAGLAAVSALGTVLVEVPFLLHLAGTSAWQTFSVLSLGLGILLFSAAVLLLRRRALPRMEWSLAVLIAAYLANASLCLVVYASSPGSPSSRSGWYLTLILVGPTAAELLWLLAPSFRSKA